MFVCLYVFVMVSWSENVHLLDGHVYAMLLFHEYLFTYTRDVHHDQLLVCMTLMDLNFDSSVQRIVGKVPYSMDNLTLLICGIYAVKKEYMRALGSSSW